MPRTHTEDALSPLRMTIEAEADDRNGQLLLPPP
jgi:hypothetical protein